MVVAPLVRCDDEERLPRATSDENRRIPAGRRGSAAPQPDARVAQETSEKSSAVLGTGENSVTVCSNKDTAKYWAGAYF